MTSFFSLGAIALGAGLLACGSARAQEAPANSRAPLVALSDAELDDARGGFEWRGMAISFGANMQTFINGQLALQTIVSWTPTGATTETTIAGFVSPTMNGSVPGGLSLSSTLAGSPVYFTNSGQTAIIQGANNALQNILINSANNVTALQQTTATVTLSNYQSFASTMRAGMIGAALGNEVASLAHH